MTTVYYYITPLGKNVVREFIVSLEKNQQAKVRRTLQVIEEYGLVSVVPHLRRLAGTPLWEIRILGKDNIRIIYVTPNRDSIVVLHGFNKKSKKTPLKEIQIALKRHQDWILKH